MKTTTTANPSRPRSGRRTRAETDCSIDTPTIASTPEPTRLEKYSIAFENVSRRVLESILKKMTPTRTDQADDGPVPEDMHRRFKVAFGRRAIEHIGNHGMGRAALAMFIAGFNFREMRSEGISKDFLRKAVLDALTAVDLAMNLTKISETEAILAHYVAHGHRDTEEGRVAA